MDRRKTKIPPKSNKYGKYVDKSKLKLDNGDRSSKLRISPTLLKEKNGTNTPTIIIPSDFSNPK